MKVIPSGTHITTKLNHIEGIITAISIRFGAVNYEISYFAVNDYKQIWMNESEFTFSAKKKVIGFQKL